MRFQGIQGDVMLKLNYLTLNGCSIIVIDLRVTWSISFESCELVEFKTDTGIKIWIKITEIWEKNSFFPLNLLVFAN